MINNINNKNTKEIEYKKCAFCNKTKPKDEMYYDMIYVNRGRKYDYYCDERCHQMAQFAAED